MNNTNINTEEFIMKKKYYESARLQDICDARNVLRQAKKHRGTGEYHADLMRVVRLHIDGVRYANKKIRAYN